MLDQHAKNWWAFIGYFLKEYKRFVIPFVSLALLSGLWAPLNSLLIKIIIDRLGLVSTEQATVWILWPAGLFVINFEVHNLCWRGMGYINYKLQPLLKNSIITETVSRVHQQSQQFFQERLAGRIAGNINTLADNTERIVHDIARQLLRTAVLIVGAFISLYLVHPKFFVVLLSWFLIFVVMGLSQSKRLVILSEAQAAAESTVSGQLVDSMTNSHNVRTFTNAAYEITHLKQYLLRANQAFQTKEWFALKLHYLQGLSISILQGCMLYYLTQFYRDHAITLGDFALIITMSLEVSFMIWHALEQVEALNRAIGHCQQSLSRLFVPQAISDQAPGLALRVTQGAISFSAVTFHYPGRALLFKKLSITIPAAQKVGLVGYSGSGKSTWVNLLLRLYEITEGQIMIDGQAIHAVTQDSLRHAIALISQDPTLFHRSLRENIRYGRLAATDQEIQLAAERAGAHQFITQLPEGYDTLVGERGVKLSGGQRQRIAMARAILKAAPILILDEATSQLDSLTENSIQETLWPFMEGKTTIVIAHRLSTLLRMDRILVFKRGQIVQDGSHTTLLQQEGLYKTLWDTQVGGYLKDNR
ncbi:ABC transporter ATP-binding protein [unidentified bacterial endosymbiont]|uniref:ABC transporter ATP-binding protein n=1 Tax=unidentified bacterial endosymbiont TaxID=2355 RepID=UPI00209D59EB|nr:ABC transporter ATP-binding protein [unidentified bacterial endosymbiont]